MFNNKKFFNEVFTNGDDYIENCKNLSKEIFKNDFSNKNEKQFIEDFYDINSNNIDMNEFKKDMESLKKINIRIFNSNGELNGKIHINKSMNTKSKVLDAYTGIGSVIPHFYNKDNKIIDIVIHKAFFKHEYKDLLVFSIYHELSHFMIEKNVGISNIGSDESEYNKEFEENFYNFFKFYGLTDEDFDIAFFKNPITQFMIGGSFILNIKREVIANALMIHVLEKRFSIGYEYFYNMFKNFNNILLLNGVGLSNFLDQNQDSKKMYDNHIEQIFNSVLKCYKKIANINSNKFLFHFEFEEEGSDLEFLTNLVKKQQMEDFFTIIA